MDITFIRATLEDDRTWRQSEIRFLRNQLANIRKGEAGLVLGIKRVPSKLRVRRWLCATSTL